ncbi:hypothetical protein X275_09090 [Marinitoga sp. 1197]|uniref:MFS transporter n=1 Tax=unclassified Marinitoga TaxID=2640159 RepID=UPI000641434F|nr:MULTISPECIES: MFS transporter [unclassified Marinitoga]KLO21515.1 hypothetical protein X275_09090 [Marinitoga sp. 1197]KLO22614.1 hypothetical protein X274_07885 [Marinitoga sp. 1155]NUU98966.1 hypothetical protein [Marinitoga sp. 1154]
MTQKKLQIFIFINIFLLSIIVNSIPPLMTTLQESFNMSVGISSFIPFSRTVGNMIISFFGAFIIAILGLRSSLVIGVGFEVLGTALFIFSNNAYILILSMFFLGAAMGQSILALISMFDHLDEKYQKYGMFHAFFGFGGISGPLFISYVLKNNMNYKIPFIFYLLISILIEIFMLVKKVPENVKYKAFKLTEAIDILGRKFIIYMLLIFTLYSGTEIGVINWGANLFNDYFHFSKEQASIFISFFWITFTFGRLITDRLYKKLEMKITVLFVLFSIIDLILIFISGKYSPYFFSLLGFLLGPIFPATQKYLNANLSHREVGLISGMVSLSIGIGAAVIVPFMGFLGDYSIIYGYIVPIISMIFVLIISSGILKIKN